MGGWKDGWIDGGKSQVKDCLQQPINSKRLTVKSEQSNITTKRKIYSYRIAKNSKFLGHLTTCFNE